MAGITRRAVIAVGAAALLTGSVLGTAAFAADPAPTNGTPTAETQKANRGQEYQQSFLSKLAAKLGVDQTKLTDSIKGAQADTIDEAVQKGNLTKDQADAMKKRIADGQPGLMMPFGGRGGPMGGEHGERGMMGKGGFGIGNGAVEKAIADTLKLSTADLQTQLKSGKTLSEIAKAQGVDEAALKTAAVAAEKAQLDQAVKDGKLTQAQADEMLKRIEAAPLMFGGMHRGR